MNPANFTIKQSRSINHHRIWGSDPTYIFTKIPEKTYTVHYNNKQCIINYEYKILGIVDPMSNKGLIAYSIDTPNGGEFIIHENGTAELNVFGSSVPITHSVIGSLK